MNVNGLEKAGNLRKVLLKKSIDSHSKCKIYMFIDGDIHNIRNYIGTDVTLENDNEILMRGRVCSVSLQKAFTRSVAVFSAVSFSESSDQKKHNRIYQNTRKKYSDIISILKNDKCNFCINEKSFSDKAVPDITVQQNETDFSFAKRLASFSGLNLFTDDTSTQCTVYIGKNLSGKKSSLKDERAIVCEYELDKYTEKIIIRSKDYLKFGSTVSFSGFDYIITEFLLEFKDSTETYTYTLQREMSSHENDVPNGSFIIGRAKVTDNKDPDSLGRIQVSFLEYDDVLADNMLWIPYVNNLTENDSGVLLIPDKDEIVNVYCCNSKCYASGCVREKSLNEKINDVSIRSIRTRDIQISISESKAEMTAFKYTVTVEENNVSLKRDKMNISVSESQINISNDKSAIILDTDKLKIATDNELNLKARTNVKVNNDKSSVTLDKSDIKLKGNNITAEGSSNVTIKTNALDIS